MKKILFLCVMLMAIAVHAQVQIQSPTQGDIDSLRKRIVIEVFGAISKDGTLDIYTLCESKVTKGLSELFRKDLKRWEVVQLLQAGNSNYKTYSLVFDPIDPSAMNVDVHVIWSYTKCFGKFTGSLPKERQSTGFSALTKDEVLKEALRRPIKLLTKICVADIVRMCQRYK